MYLFGTMVIMVAKISTIIAGVIHISTTWSLRYMNSFYSLNFRR